jgi:hydrogenase maturation protease
MEDKRCVVVGIGNRFMTDDSVGLIVAAELRRRGLPSGVKVIKCGTDEFSLLDELENAGSVVIVDAVLSGKPPGTISVFSPDETELAWNSCGTSLHMFSLAETIALARALGVSAGITVVGIEPESVEPGEKLTPSIAASLQKIVEVVLDTVRNSRTGQARYSM